MASTATAVDRFLEARDRLWARQGSQRRGVATSQLEMAQNSSMQQWSLKKVDTKLQAIMAGIHSSVRAPPRSSASPPTWCWAPTIAGFRKVADAMIDQGVR